MLEGRSDKRLLELLHLYLCLGMRLSHNSKAGHCPRLRPLCPLRSWEPPFALRHTRKWILFPRVHCWLPIIAVAISSGQ